MPTYVSLINWTDQGIRTVKETLDRADKFEELAQKHGASLEQVYWTVGPYDIVAIIEAPDDETATAVLLEGSTLATSGLQRFAPTTAIRCLGSSKDSVELTTTPGQGSLSRPGPSSLALFTELPRA